MTVHVMLDLETWGTAAGSALRSIGAVTFSPYGAPEFVEEVFYANIDRQSCELVGMTVDPATVEWWSRQSREAEAALVADQRPIYEVVTDFTLWWEGQGATYIWSNGANFDEPLWRAAFAACGRSAVPWKYWNVRDTRTCWHMARLNPKSIVRAGIAHDALADGRHQALCVTMAYSILDIKPAA